MVFFFNPFGGFSRTLFFVFVFQRFSGFYGAALPYLSGMFLEVFKFTWRLSYFLYTFGRSLSDGVFWDFQGYEVFSRMMGGF